MRVLYLMGKSATGKDTIFNILKEKLDINNYVMYTTRPKRQGEIDGKTYKFLSNEEMNSFTEGSKKDKLIEYRIYDTIHGPWTYATIYDEQFCSDKDLLMLGTLESYMKMKEYFNEKIIPIYIEVEDEVRLQRALDREKEQKEPKYVELCRRFVADSKDFSEENIKKANIEIRFKNNELDKCVKEIIEYINK